jgi:hypothetical protein
MPFGEDDVDALVTDFKAARKAATATRRKRR